WWPEGKIERILQIMLKRERLTQAEYDAAIATPLAFSKDGTESEDDCIKRVKKAIKNARPTNPLAALASKDGDPVNKQRRDHRDKPDKSEKRERHSRRHAEDRPPI